MTSGVIIQLIQDDLGFLDLHGMGGTCKGQEENEEFHRKRIAERQDAGLATRFLH